MRYALALAGSLAAAALSTSCAGAGSPSTPSAPSLSAFSIAMPIAAGDSASYAYTVWPFGVHSGGHAPDGHPGFDIEYRLGAPVLAAADGFVISVSADAHDSSRSRVQLRHARDRGDYMTDYSNLVDVSPAVIAGAAIVRGQRLGAAGSFIDGRSGMTHFQIADPTRSQSGVAESAIVSPVEYLTADGRALLDAIWVTAAYRAEWCEPLLTNSRANVFPMSRTWTADAGGSRIVVTCPNDTTDMAWANYAADGTLLESGTLQIDYSARPTTADVKLSSGATRRALYDIVGTALRLAIAEPGAPRPASLDSASRFTTQ